MTSSFQVPAALSPQKWTVIKGQSSKLDSSMSRGRSNRSTDCVPEGDVNLQRQTTRLVHPSVHCRRVIASLPNAEVAAREESEADTTLDVLQKPNFVRWPQAGIRQHHHLQFLSVAVGDDTITGVHRRLTHVLQGHVHPLLRQRHHGPSIHQPVAEFVAHWIQSNVGAVSIPLQSFA